MPWAKVTLNPGVNVQQTPTLNQAGYTNSNLGRFRNKLFEKIGGWQKYISTKFSRNAHKLHAWLDLNGNSRLAVATTRGLYDVTNGVVTEISPQYLVTQPAINLATTAGSNIVTVTDTLVNNITIYDTVTFYVPITIGGIVLSRSYPVVANLSATSYQIQVPTPAVSTVAAPGGATATFTTTTGSNVVTVVLANHGVTVGSDVVFPVSTAVGDLSVVGRYIVASVTDANTFTILANASTALGVGPITCNGGLAEYQYALATGPQLQGQPYGSGTYGTGTYGMGNAISGQTGTATITTDYDLDNWGDILLVGPYFDTLYWWGPASGMANARAVSQAPTLMSGLFVSMNQQIVVGYGVSVNAGIGFYQDPLMVAWSDSGNFMTWTPSITNQAGSYRIPTGAAIMGAIATPQRNLIWTNTDLYTMDYIGSQFVFGFTKVGSNFGLIADHAYAQLGDKVYWMGLNNFYAYGGGSGVITLDCPVWDAVFQDMQNPFRCFAGSNSSFNEIMFFYQSISSGTAYDAPDKYVKYNVLTGEWDIGTMPRTSWLDKSVFPYPLAGGADQFIYQHDTGFDADGSAIDSFFETGYFYLSEGEDITVIDRIYPDFKWGPYNGAQTAQIQITVQAVMNADDTPTVYGPYTVTAASPYIPVRVRARQIKLRVESNDTGSWWRAGAIRFRFQPDGRR